MKRVKGSMTVFASLSLLLILAFFFTMLEAARVQGLRAYVKLCTLNSQDALASYYHRWIYDNYGVFLLDGGMGSGELSISELSAILQKNAQKNCEMPPSLIETNQTHFYQMTVTDGMLEQFALATDEEGKVFRNAVVLQNKEELAWETVEELISTCKEQKTKTAEVGNLEDVKRQAEEEIRLAKEEQEKAKAAAAANVGDGTVQLQVQASGAGSNVENPLDVLKKIKQKGIVALVVSPDQQLSEASLVDHMPIERRAKNIGTMKLQLDESDAVMRMAYLCYLQDHMNSFLSDKGVDESALFYELEYVIAGKSSDYENLKVVVHELLAYREALNYLYLQTDEVKKAEALGIATSLLAATGFAPMIPVVQQGLLAAWAYAESIVDVRALLSGEQVPWMKTAMQWNTSLTNLGQCADTKQTGIACEQGLDYEQYLLQLLFIKSDAKLHYRGIDLIVANAAKASANENIKGDCLLVAWKSGFSYQAKPVFLNLVSSLQPKADLLSFHITDSYSYMKQLLPNGAYE